MSKPLKTITFKATSEGRYGALGWLLDEPGNETFDPGVGMTVAHDCLEHVDGDDSLPSEFMAFGAMYYVRGLGDYFTPLYNPEPPYHQAGEIAMDLFRAWNDDPWDTNNRECRYKGLFPPCLDVGYCEDWLQDAFAQARKQVRDEELGALTDFDEFACRAKPWFRKGYWEIQDLYGETPPWRLTEWFRLIEKKANDSLKYAEDGWSQLKVTVYRDKEPLVVFEEYPEYDEDEY